MNNIRQATPEDIARVAEIEIFNYRLNFYPIFLCDEKKYVKVEVQLRTIAMESWARLEHRMRYKKNLDSQLIGKTSDALNECAEISCELDRKMQDIRSIIEGI